MPGRKNPLASEHLESVTLDFHRALRRDQFLEAFHHAQTAIAMQTISAVCATGFQFQGVVS